MTRPGERDERSHGETYPGPGGPDGQDERDRYGLRPTPSTPGDRKQKPPPPAPARRRRR